MQPTYIGRESSCYLLDEDAAPPGPLEAAEPPPLMPPDEDDAPPPLVPPMPDDVLLSVEELELEGELGVTVVEDEDDPPGTMTVSFSFVVVDDIGAELPGTTVVVSFFSQAERASVPTRTNR